MELEILLMEIYRFYLKNVDVINPSNQELVKINQGLDEIDLAYQAARKKKNFIDMDPKKSKIMRAVASKLEDKHEVVNF